MRNLLRNWAVQLTPAMAGAPNEPDLKAGLQFAMRGWDQKNIWEE